MKKKALYFLYIALFLTISLLPTLGMAVFGESESLANEVRTEEVSPFLDDGSFNRTVLKEYAKYFSEHIAFRKQLVTAWDKLNAAFFRTSAQEKIILGSDGWLYFSPTLDDFMGRSLSNDELERCAQTLAAMQQACEKQGATFVFTIAPNKNSLYAEHMPSWIPAGHDSANAVKLRPYLERYGVNYVDLFALYADREETLYYRTDSHWTDRGAALAADALYAAFGIDTDYFSGPFSQGDGHRGDLYNMIYPAGTEKEPSEEYAPGFSFVTKRNPNGGEANRIEALNEQGSGRLLCWRDSFGNSLYPYLADRFESAMFVKSSDYDLSLIRRSGADVVLFELVERELPTLTDASVLLPDEER